MTEENNKAHVYRIETSAILTISGIALLFLSSILATVLAPNMLDPSWTQSSSHFQVQMHEVSDPNLYIARAVPGSPHLDYVYHLKDGFTLMAFKESETLRILAPIELEHYVTRLGDKQLKLTSHLLLLRQPTTERAEEAEKLRKTLQDKWEKDHPNWKEKDIARADYSILELFDPKLKEAFSLSRVEGVLDDYVDTDFVLLEEPTQDYQKDPGVIYVDSPAEYRIKRFTLGSSKGFRYDPTGQPVKDLTELTSNELGFISRKDLIATGERIFAQEGCWYCHTDQSRTLIQDSVLNGSESFAAPPSSGNEYIYQNVTFPGTRRIGPDLARVGVKRPSRDWNKSHFWQPRTESPGSIMPSFRHFFDDDPRGQSKSQIGIPNYRFEAIFQYMMTKGTRITPPTKAWWLGKDPLKTTEIIEGKKFLKVQD
ncbi:MAG: cbb3-type cytochrome c oxidase subunit II [Chlamydiales bacterium]|nr:cbb3-type cytochrome c oxidase subunit II [Chlamydiales bacterium]